MGIISVNTNYGPVEFVIAGDAPTAQEESKIQDALVDARDLFPKTASVEEQGFDTTTGIQDAGFRAALSFVDTFDEKQKVLEKYGLGKEDYTLNNRGDIALTPSGAKMFGVETDKPVMIDESGFSKYDLADLAGIAPEVTGAVSGAIAGQIAIPIPVVGAVIGAFVGGGGANLLEEAFEAGAGVSTQSAGEIAKQTAKEAVISGLGEGAGQLLFKGVGAVARGLKPKLTDEQLKIIQASREMGIDPSLNLMGAPAILSRQQAISEKIFKTSPRLKKNNDSIIAQIEKFRNSSGVDVSDVDALGSLLQQATRDGNKKLLTEHKNLQTKILSHMENVANQVGRAAKKDGAIDDAVMGALTTAFKSFDDLAEANFSKVDNLVNTSVGTSEIIPTAKLSALAKKQIPNYKNIVSGTSQSLEKEILQAVKGFGPKSSFGQLYKARKSLSDIKLMNGGEQGVVKFTSQFIDEIDNILGRSNLESLSSGAFRTSTGGAGAGSRKAMLDASDSLRDARRIFAQGMKQFDALENHAIVKEIASSVRLGKDINAAKTMERLIQGDNPKLLQSVKNVLDEQSSKAGITSPYEDLRSRMAGEWIRKTLKDSMNPAKPNKFKGTIFKKKFDDLGTTADELFGSKIGEVRRLAEQLDSLSLSNLSDDVVKDTIAAGFTGTGDDGINLLKSLKNKHQELSVFEKNKLFRKLQDGNIDPAEAAGFIANRNTSTSDISKVMGLFDESTVKGAETLAKIRQTYMDDLISDFGDNFLLEPKQFKLFANRIEEASKNKKLGTIFDNDTAEEIAKFGRVLKFNSKSAEGGDLIAANIAASPLQNLGALARFTVMGRVFSSKAFYKNFDRQYKAMIKRENSVSGRARLTGEIIAQLIGSSISQSSTQLLDEAVTSTANQAKSLIGNALKPQQVSQRRTPTPVPNVTPGRMSNISAPPDSSLIFDVDKAAQSAIRQRAAQNPAVAASLLGGLGNADLL